MLPKENRLTDDHDFRRVKRLGKRYHGSVFSLTVAPQKVVTAPRFGFVVSTRIDKRATVRNQIKRRLREAVRSSLINVSKGFDLVFVVRPDIKSASYEEISAEVDKVLSKVSFSGPRLGEEAFSDR